MAQHHTHERIIKLARRGLSPESIARKIGRPGDVERVREALDKHAQDLNKSNSLIGSVENRIELNKSSDEALDYIDCPAPRDSSSESDDPKR